MDRKDAEGVPWMAAHSRNPWPKTLVWRQGHTTHPRFSWLSVPPEEMTNGRTIRASVDGQTITLHSADVRRVDLLLHDALLDLDRPITVIANGHTVFEGSVARTESAIAQSLRLRPDPRMIATASVSIEIPAE
jgi:hypothetical protein